MCIRFIRLPNLFEYTCIRLVQSRRQLAQYMRDILWEAMPQRFQLAENPSEPCRDQPGVIDNSQSAYIPSARSESVWMTISLCSSLHLFITVFEEERTTDLM